MPISFILALKYDPDPHFKTSSNLYMEVSQNESTWGSPQNHPELLGTMGKPMVWGSHISGNLHLAWLLHVVHIAQQLSSIEIEHICQLSRSCPNQYPHSFAVFWETNSMTINNWKFQMVDLSIVMLVVLRNLHIGWQRFLETSILDDYVVCLPDLIRWFAQPLTNGFLSMDDN